MGGARVSINPLCSTKRQLPKLFFQRENDLYEGLGNAGRAGGRSGTGAGGTERAGRGSGKFGGRVRGGPGTGGR